MNNHSIIRPSVGVATIVIKNREILVGDDPKGIGVPGGHWENGETLRECAAREVAEESGIVCTNIQLISIYDFFRHDKGNSYLTVGMKADYLSGDVRDLLSEGRKNWIWMNPNDALKLKLFPPDRVLIERYLSGVVYN